MEIILLYYSIILTLVSIIYLSIKKRFTGIVPVIVFSITALIIWVLALKYYYQYLSWMQEDGPGEWITFYLFFFAGLLVLRTLIVQVREKAGWKIVVTCGLFIFCIFVAGEEISWGQRLFGFKPPNIFLESNFQQELNIHNFFTKKRFAGFSLDTRFIISLICISYGVAGSIIAFIWPFKKYKNSIKYTFPSVWLSPLFAFIAWMELTYPFKFAGESAELLLGMVFMICILQLDDKTEFKPKYFLTLILLPVIIGIGTPGVVEKLNSFGNRERIEITKVELGKIKNDLRAKGLIFAKLKTRRLVHKRLYTAVKQGYIRFGYTSSFLNYRPTPGEKNSLNPRKDRTGYFLDPWNYPYWIFYDYATKKIYLYSFGPNRKRDSKLSSDDQLIMGDDIAVMIDLKLIF